MRVTLIGLGGGTTDTLTSRPEMLYKLPPLSWEPNGS